MHSVCVLSKKVEDNEVRELDVSRKETVFKSLIIFKQAAFLCPSPWLRLNVVRRRYLYIREMFGFSPVCM